MLYRGAVSNVSYGVAGTPLLYCMKQPGQLRQCSLRATLGHLVEGSPFLGLCAGWNDEATVWKYLWWCNWSLTLRR